MLKKLKSKSFKNILSKVYAWKWPTQCISEWLSKKRSENEMLKLWNHNNIDHGLLESRTGNSNITIKKAKIDARISAKIDKIISFLF